VFCDLKLFDVPATVGAAVAGIARRGATFLTVHGNQATEAAARTKAHSRSPVHRAHEPDRLDDLGFGCDVEALVRARAVRSGRTHGVISWPEAAKLRAEIDQRLIVITPASGRQSAERRSEARRRRRTGVPQRRRYIVVGRPITMQPIRAAPQSRSGHHRGIFRK
jgi:orotidine-5'-phosphate decarboxylase